ncbi:lysophosphatidic acid receptor 5-like [Betta splendens]|uniref:Lysophosphatidic acid receptor 5-like n=1 Tax=Betta splendens TaxID=158456 RepID=A0A6P7P3E2_BETSP|nr:lysophosphatidic acid receptor 5-like [Betta splendens]
MNSSLQASANATAAPQPGFAAAYGVIAALGLPLNAASLWILLRRHSLRAPGAVFMLNLAASDLMLVASLPARSYAHATGTWPLSGAACAAVLALFRANLRSSAVFISLISVDRLLAVVFPLRSRHLRTAANAWKAAALAWILVSAASLPQLLPLPSSWSGGPNCFLPRSDAHGRLVPVAQSVLIFVLLAVNVLCTAVVSVTLRRHRPDARVRNTVDVMLIFIMNLVMFTLCFLPLSIGLLQFGNFHKTLPPLICLASVNCCLDPLLYYFSLDAFWKRREDVDPATGR